MRRVYKLGLLICTGCLSLFAIGVAILGFWSRSSGPPLIVLISVDTLRWDHLGLSLGDRSEEDSLTPALDQFSEEAVSFSTVLTPMAFTLPAHMTIFTGLHPLAHGVSDEKSVLGEGITTLPEILRAHGYKTIGIFSNQWLKGKFGFGRGFDQYLPVRGLSVAGQIREKASSVIDDLEGSQLPLFIFAHFYDVHSDWEGGRNNLLPYFFHKSFRSKLALARRSFALAVSVRQSFCWP